MPEQEAAGEWSPPRKLLKLEKGLLQLKLRDNSLSPRVLSGIQSLVHAAEPDFDAFDPDTTGASAGLNFEHVIVGRADPANRFAPRGGAWTMQRSKDGRVRWTRPAEAGPFGLRTELLLWLTEPHSADFELGCAVQDPAALGPHGYVVLFFANYLNDVADDALHFRGVERDGAPERWIRAAAETGPEHYHRGGTYRSVSGQPLRYAADHNLAFNLWSYDDPRFVLPLVYGRAARDMVLILMFDRSATEVDEVRFSLFRFKYPDLPRPAWDFQYVLRRPQPGQRHVLRGRMIWKKWQGEEDVLEEHRVFSEALAGR